MPDTPAGPIGDPLPDLAVPGVDTLADAVPAPGPVAPLDVPQDPLASGPLSLPVDDAPVAGGAPVGAGVPAASRPSAATTTITQPTSSPRRPSAVAPPTTPPTPQPIPRGLCARAFAPAEVARAFGRVPTGLQVRSTGSGTSVECVVTGPAASGGTPTIVLTVELTSSANDTAADTAAGRTRADGDGDGHTLVTRSGTLVAELHAPDTTVAQAREALPALARRLP